MAATPSNSVELVPIDTVAIPASDAGTEEDFSRADHKHRLEPVPGGSYLEDMVITKDTTDDLVLDFIRMMS